MPTSMARRPEDGTTWLEPDDAHLVQRAQRGERGAFDALVARHKQRTFDLVSRLINDPQTAEDLTVEALGQAYRSLRGFRGQSTFSTWLHRITVNVCRNELRRSRRRGRIAEVPLTEANVDPSEATDEIVHRKLRVESVLEGLHALSERQRVALLLFFVEGRTHEEIADVMTAPVNTVKSHIRRGLTNLRKLVGTSMETETTGSPDHGETPESS